MADIWSGKVGNNWCPQIHLVVSLAAGNADHDVLNWYADYVAHGYAAYTNGHARAWSINIDGQVRSGSFNINGQTGTVRLGSGQVTVNKTHAYRNVGVSCSMTMDFTWNGSYLGTASGSGTQPIGEKSSYTVSYNANGGSGAPGNQTKWHGENLDLSGTKPTRTGHNFDGWATSASGAVAYQPGATYTGNGNLTLYAKWTPHTYTVSYNANGGSGAPGNQTKTYGVNLELSSTIPKRTNYNFKGWGTSSSSTTASYQPGSTYTNNSGITLYAIWELAWLEPRITNLQATRCDSAGTLTEEGQYAKVTFNWATDRTVSSIEIACNGTTTEASGSGTSGSVSVVVGNNGLSTETQYTVRVTIADAVGSAWRETIVPPLNFIMDIAPNGSIAFGKPANQSKRSFETSIPTYNLAQRNGLSSDWSPRTSNEYRILAKSDLTYNSVASRKSVRITGIIGSWGASSQGFIDVTIPLRSTSSTTININSFSPQCFGAPTSLMVVIGSDNYIYFIIWRKSGEYGYYNLEFFGEDVTIINSDWSSNRVTGNVIFDSNVRNENLFGGYPLKTEFQNGYYGVTLPDRTRTEWLRTTEAGLIPYRAGGASALGAESWPFNRVWTNELNWTGNGLKGRVMKQIWSGSLGIGGRINVPELPYYNAIGVRSNTYGIMLFGLRYTPGNNQIHFSAAGDSGSSHFMIMGSFANVSGTSLIYRGGCYHNFTDGTVVALSEINTIYGIL